MRARSLLLPYTPPCRSWERRCWSRWRKASDLRGPPSSRRPGPRRTGCSPCRLPRGWRKALRCRQSKATKQLLLDGQYRTSVLFQTAFKRGAGRSALRVKASTISEAKSAPIHHVMSFRFLVILSCLLMDWRVVLRSRRSEAEDFSVHQSETPAINTVQWQAMPHVGLNTF